MAVDQQTLVAALAKGDTRSVGARGVITLPQSWRDAQAIEPGDSVAVMPAEDHLKVYPIESEPPEPPAPGR